MSLRLALKASLELAPASTCTVVVPSSPIQTDEVLPLQNEKQNDRASEETIVKTIAKKKPPSTIKTLLLQSKRREEKAQKRAANAQCLRHERCIRPWGHGGPCSLQPACQEAMTKEAAIAAAEREGLPLLRGSSSTGFKHVYHKNKMFALVIRDCVKGADGKAPLHSFGSFATAEAAALAYSRHIGKAAAEAEAKQSERATYMSADEARALAAQEGLTFVTAPTRSGYRHVYVSSVPNLQLKYALQISVQSLHLGKKMQSLGYYGTAEEAALEAARYFRDKAEEVLGWRGTPGSERCGREEVEKVEKVRKVEKVPATEQTEKKETSVAAEQEQQEDAGEDGEDDVEDAACCLICLETLLPEVYLARGREGAWGHVQCTRKCDATFHHRCISRWLNEYDGMQAGCPQCRSGVARTGSRMLGQQSRHMAHAPRE